MLDDTIAAIATPLGEGGLAVIRLSGSRAFVVADKSFRPVGRSSVKPSAAPTHTIHYGKIVRNGRMIDEVLLSVMRAPRTFTREDVVEVTCHGGILAAKLVLDTLLENGARLAEPGEFTLRAFLNGRIDLTQAEAVMDLIHARTELSLAAASEQLAGKLSQRIDRLRDDMMKTLAHIEAHIDFPDEDISPDTRDQLLSRLELGVAFMDELLRTANEGQILRRGIRAAIVGRPNAGKSSLLNQLLGHDRAIVSPIPGTTRDTIEETADIRGLPVVFVDTAGLREAGDVIEEEGVRRSHATVAKAELILHVFDAAEPFTAEDQGFLVQFSHKRRIVVRNKIDLPVKLALPAGLVEGASLHEPKHPLTPALSPTGGEGARRAGEGGQPHAGVDSIPAQGSAVVDVCSLTGQGIESLKDAIRNMVWAGEIKAGMLQAMINSRHQDALRRAREATVRTIEALRNDLTLELVAIDLRIAVNAVGEIVGKTTTEDLLDSIFSQFCIGK
jgi:tRNA modification GTPase